MDAGSGSLVTGLWGYLQGDPVIVGIVVGAIVVFAVLYVVLRARGKGPERAKKQ